MQTKMRKVFKREWFPVYQAEDTEPGKASKPFNGDSSPFEKPFGNFNGVYPFIFSVKGRPFATLSSFRYRLRPSRVYTRGIASGERELAIS